MQARIPTNYAASGRNETTTRRKDSRIIGLRVLNNFVKALALRMGADRIRTEGDVKHVFDMCCGPASDYDKLCRIFGCAAAPPPPAMMRRR